MKRFVLLDRDGTINVERHYLSDPDQIELLPDWHWAAAGFEEHLFDVVVGEASQIGAHLRPSRCRHD